jgi:hypothetical protein
MTFIAPVHREERTFITPVHRKEICSKLQVMHADVKIFIYHNALLTVLCNLILKMFNKFSRKYAH